VAGDPNAGRMDSPAALGASDSAGCKIPACRLQLALAASQIDRVVGVGTVRRAATGKHQPTTAELTQVVRKEVLRLVDQLGELPHRTITAHQLP
jgi:hypothetical protein